MAPDDGRPVLRDLLDREELEERARALARTLRSLAHRSVHPFRSGLVRARLRSLERADSVLFVCHGNICRSPYAEAYYRQRVGPRAEVGSVGFLEAGRTPPDEALEAAAERGIDLSDHRSRTLERGVLATASLVVVMDPAQDRELRRRFRRRADLVLGDLDPRPADRRAIRDPVFQPVAVFGDVYDRIERCLDVLARTLGHRRRADRRGTGEGAA